MNEPDELQPTVRVLTPAGTAAVAVVEVLGDAWPVVEPLFKSATGKAITPRVGQFYFGRFGPPPGDEVLLAFTPRGVEVQCHGGPRVVAWVVEQLRAAGCVEATEQSNDAESLLPFATTARTAAILLDQHAGAFREAVNAIRTHLESGDADTALNSIDALLRYAAVGRHLVQPFRVAVAGPPNVGKSSLVNALAGFQRAVVSDVPGTTRDIVAVSVAFDGWPVELLDTAGLRAGGDDIESRGVELAEAAHAASDLRLWVLDSSDEKPVLPPPSPVPTAIAANKSDLPAGSKLHPDWHPVSAATGAGVPGLMAAVVRVLTAGETPPVGAAVPFSDDRIQRLEAARAAVAVGNLTAAGAALPDGGPRRRSG